MENKNLTKCKSCNADVAKKAKVCPNCGAKKKKPIYFRWWFILIILVLVIAVAGTETVKEASTAGVSTNAPTTPTTPTTPATPTTPTTPTETIYTIGDSFTVGSFEFSISSVEETNTILSGNQFTKDVTTDEKFILIEAKIKNNDKEERTLDTSMVKLLDNQGREFSGHSAFELMMILGDKYLFLEKFNPGMSRVGVFVFEVPKDVSEYSAIVYPGIWFKTGKPVKVKLK